jgi:hypothetical protein
MAYAPASSSPVDRPNVVAASAPMPRSYRAAASQQRTSSDTIAVKGPQGQASMVATSARLAAASRHDVWMRIMMLAPSATSAMNTTVLGEADMSMLRAHFTKPQAAIVMSFSNDPQMGLLSDRFAGPAIARLVTQSFVLQTASLR